MRCKYCGSKMLFPDTKHENFSTGKAVAGAVAFGVVGAAAGFIGKDTKGYRCSACGMFSETPMDIATETACDSAIREAKAGGSSAAYVRCKEQYPNIEQVELRSSAPSAESPRQSYDTPPAVTAAAPGSSPAPQVKRSYHPNTFFAGCPVFVEEVRILETPDTNLLDMDVYNISGKTLRSAYFTVTVFDDVGDEIGKNECIYQKLNAAPGDYLQSSKSFDLKTEAAHKVTIVCNKAAFIDDSVWRDPQDAAIALAEREEITPENFKLYDYLRILLAEKSKLPKDRRIYQPVFEADHRICICGTPVAPGCTCNVCGLTEEALPDILDYDALVHIRRKLIAKVASIRAEKSQALLKQAQAEVYEKANALLAKKTAAAYKEAGALFRTLGEYKDAKEKVALCTKRYEELKAKEEADRLARERAAEEARQEEERRRREEQERLERETQEEVARRKKVKIIITIISSIVFAAIATVFLLNQFVWIPAKIAAQEAEIAALEAQRAEKYQYILNHKTREDETTIAYLNELLELNYKDCANIYDELTKWNVTMVTNLDPNDSTTNMTTFPRLDRLYVHIFVTGGPFDAKEVKYPIYINTEAQFTYSECIGNAYDGYQYTYSFQPAFFESPITLTVEIDDFAKSKNISIQPW